MSGRYRSAAGAAMHPDWHHGVCACGASPPACLESFFCHFCLISRTRNMLENQEPEIEWCCCLFLTLCDGVLMHLPSCCCQMCNRKGVRERYGISGSGCEDCCCAFFCPCCLSAQLLLEMSKRGDCPGACCCQDRLEAGGRRQVTVMA